MGKWRTSLGSKRKLEARFDGVSTVSEITISGRRDLRVGTDNAEYGGSLMM